jgi:flagellar biosynthesis/type III secretory pathway protein FliH
MNSPRARILRSPQAAGATLLSLQPSAGRRRRVAREELEAQLAADRILQEARLQAADLVARARQQAIGVAEQLAREAREEAEAKLAAHWLRLRTEEGTRLERDTERVIGVAVALAERLLGAALELDPSRIVDLARAALAEARGARRIAIGAHPLDADALRQHLDSAALGVQAVEVRVDETLARGELRLQTDVGTIDAKLSPRLDRLAAALRDALV